MESIQIDEVEISESGFLLHLLSSILQLSYACLCNEALWNSVECEGCEFNWPSQKDHLCLILADEPDDVWFYYFDEAIQRVQSSRVWRLAKEVAFMLEIEIHPSWMSYIPELFKLPRTTVYLTYYQIERLADINDKWVNQIMEVLCKGNLKITSRKKTLTKASSIVCPVESLKTGEENMNIDI
jgi:hypothetical protein